MGEQDYFITFRGKRKNLEDDYIPKYKHQCIGERKKYNQKGYPDRQTAHATRFQINNGSKTDGPRD